MLSFFVNHHLHLANPFRIRTYNSAPPYPLCLQHLPALLASVPSKALTAAPISSQPQQNQHLHHPLASVVSKRLITLLNSTLTRPSTRNPFRMHTYRNTGGEGAHHPVQHQNGTDHLSVAVCLASSPTPAHRPFVMSLHLTSPIRLLS